MNSAQHIVVRPADLPAIQQEAKNPVLLYLAHLTDSGRRSQMSALVRIAGLFDHTPASMPWCSVTYEMASVIKARLRQEGLKPATINRLLSALRGVLREAWRCGLIPHEQFARIDDVSNEKNQTLPAGRALERSETRALLDAFESPRDRAILAVFVHGLRRTEITALTLGDVLPHGLRVVKGKGGKERLVPYVGDAAKIIGQWIEQHARRESTAPLFYRVDRHGNSYTDSPLTADALYKIVTAGAKRAGIDNVKPHDLRRTFCTNALKQGVGIDLVAHIAGHASVDTTRRYDRSQDERSREAMRNLDLI